MRQMRYRVEPLVPAVQCSGIRLLFANGVQGVSLKVCSVTLKYAKIGCQQSLSTEAAEVARGKCGTEWNVLYLLYNVPG